MKRVLLAIALAMAVPLYAQFTPQPLTPKNTGIRPLGGLFALPSLSFGGKSTQPTPIVAGVPVWDETNLALKVWDGSAWVPVGVTPDLTPYMKLDGSLRMTGNLPLFKGDSTSLPLLMYNQGGRLISAGSGPSPQDDFALYMSDDNAAWRKLAWAGENVPYTGAAFPIDINQQTLTHSWDSLGASGTSILSNGGWNMASFNRFSGVSYTANYDADFASVQSDTSSKGVTTSLTTQVAPASVDLLRVNDGVQTARATLTAGDGLRIGDSEGYTVQAGIDGTITTTGTITAPTFVGDLTGTASGNLTAETDPSIPSRAGNALKTLRVNAGETALEWAAGGGGMTTAANGGTGQDSSAWNGVPVVRNGVWSGADAPTRPLFLEHDFLSYTWTYQMPVSSTVMSSGTATYTNYQNHPGAFLIASSANANSGAQAAFGLYSMGGQQYWLSGGERAEYIFMIPATNANTYIFMGLETRSVTAPSPATPFTNGAWFQMNNTTMQGRCTGGSGVSTTGTSFTPSISAWYRGRIVINSNMTRVDYYIYSSTGTLLWSDYLTTNMPNTTTGTIGDFNAYNSAGGSVQMIAIDYMGFLLPGVTR
jgi:hypothetical protein